MEDQLRFNTDMTTAIFATIGTAGDLIPLINLAKQFENRV